MLPGIRVITLLFSIITGLYSCNNSPKPGSAKPASKTEENKKPSVWKAPSFSTLTNSELDQLIKYGHDLIANTAMYIGPHGKISHGANGMNCQNCHLEAGTKPFGNNYGGVASTYPKFRERSNSIEGIYKRVNDCLQRSLNGKPLDTLSHEMQAIKCYIEWLGKDVKKGQKPPGAGIPDLPYLVRAAEPENGRLVYTEKCKVCHGDNGEGKMNTDNITYQYPPLWGKGSYTIGAGLYRLSRFAGYVKNNMPFGTNYDAPQLSDEQAWDVAAFVNSQQRPDKNISKDYPVTASKPVDYPFPPYADPFKNEEHKYGPFGDIAIFKKEHSGKKQ